LLVDFGQERGLAPAKLLAGTQLSLAQLSDPNVELTAAQELRVTGNLLRLLKHPAGLGLELGVRYHFSAYGVWGYGLISSATAGDAMALALRFLPLTYAFTVITYHEEEHLGVLSFGEPELADDVKRFVVERDMAAAAVLLHEIGGDDFALSRFTLRASRPPSAHGLAQVGWKLFGVEPECSARLNSLAFDRSFLRRPLPQANPITASMCEQMCSRLIEERRVRLGTAAMIRHYLSAAPGTTLPTLGNMARLMNTSERTLKRRLHDEGTTFRALLAESRSAMAETLLRESGLALGEIAERLGFADLSTFSQAFKRWYGVAPSAFRSRALHTEETE
jgi:AraC-like DNA-binding protein